MQQEHCDLLGLGDDKDIPVDKPLSNLNCASLAEKEDPEEASEAAHSCCTFWHEWAHVTQPACHNYCPPFWYPKACREDYAGSTAEYLCKRDIANAICQRHPSKCKDTCDDLLETVVQKVVNACQCRELVKLMESASSASSVPSDEEALEDINPKCREECEKNVPAEVAYLAPSACAFSSSSIATSSSSSSDMSSDTSETATVTSGTDFAASLRDYCAQRTPYEEGGAEK